MAFNIPKNDLGIPLLGIGSGTLYYKRETNLPPNEKLVKTFTTAVEKGFVHLDSAEIYDNDLELKETLKRVLSEGNIIRENIFITDKYYVGDGTYTNRSKYSSPYERIKELLKYLETPYIDLYLLHAPFIKKELHGFNLKEAWEYMQQAYDEGLVKRIGVSNFTVEDIEEIWGTTTTNPQVNQIEFSAFLQNQTPGIVSYCQSHGIFIEAYSPLSPLNSVDLTQGAGLKFDEYLGSLVKKYSKTKLQVLLRWVIQLGIVPITTTSKLERFDEYQGIFNWVLTDSEVNRLSLLGSNFQPVFRKYWKLEYSKFDIL
ncbi:hypothetical protein C6P40_001652 [Pichia californica]|uniref:NADP-dependent oxidoreductase domain-containing protein n=1 Tax=Pichia californica TaxID=460514 RepID=A0A9P7BIL4_9ASCO|nr:hypothetical protein C6P42_000050 [[Candida] californica]KAG0691368.1 hypothetical protein C6P40_001652 [[Candida] californica]